MKMEHGLTNLIFTVPCKGCTVAVTNFYSIPVKKICIHRTDSKKKPLNVEYIKCLGCARQLFYVWLVKCFVEYHL